MEKFEKHIKEKLEAREITPSSKAWEKISEELSGVQESKPKRKYGYMMAAAMVGLLIALGIFLFQNESDENPLPLVETENPSKEILEKEDVPDFKMEKTEVVKVAEQTSTESQIEIASQEPNQIGVETEELENINKLPIQDSAIVISEDIINKKANEVLKQVILIENSANSAITDAEVDSLLRAAQRDIFTDKLINPEGKVDALALLTEVEDELDESFRDQIFEALKQGYLKVRTAVADRNN